jgi:hypothetical protein
MKRGLSQRGATEKAKAQIDGDILKRDQPYQSQFRSFFGPRLVAGA